MRLLLPRHSQPRQTLTFRQPSFATLIVTSLLLCSSFACADEIDFDRQIRPILAKHCLACHGFDAHSRQADLRLDTREGALHSGSGDAIVPHDTQASQLLQRIQSQDAAMLMPPPEFGKPLDEEQKRLLARWIEAGADYAQHWAFQPLMAASSESGAKSATSDLIDHWVADAHQRMGLEFSPPASPATLLRRLCLDLTGLPPTLQEQDQFLASYATDPHGAYAATVERLLASSHYGERWGRWWLDQARYADSNGYSVDAPRQIWLFRDWVVAALNRDQPFDQFTIEQIAGDLLPNASESQKIATGFHRNTPHNEEGGIDVEQFRIESVVDRVATTGTVWLGLTIGCAQCHDHKFDPISQAEFYRLFAFFNQQDEPKLKVHWTSNPDPVTSPTEPTAEVTTLVMQERTERRPTHLLIKGDFTRPAEAVEPGTPAVLPSLSARGAIPDRLDLARWLVAPENPLTARVIVNRVWQVYFGRGLVESDSDFGLQGMSPTHPELLDAVAARWVEQGWGLKQLHRWIVMSRTYQQSSHVSKRQVELDPTNLWLSRQQRLRLDAELVRDAALVASGQLTTTIGGPPVFPPIPAGAMSLGQVNRPWKVSTGPDRFRRSLYTFTYRAVPPPMLNVFDAPDGVQACTRRLRSNTPLQALTLMNDAGFFEMAQSLAMRIESEGLEAAFRRCTSRLPTAEELAILAGLSPLDAARVLLNLDETISRE
ncbi:MAG: PSD1 domain-containing protein [Planctomycetaceae bacterium]|nr:PSD1 domain-containing protein [Planctomycetaceae bacterium]